MHTCACTPPAAPEETVQYSKPVNPRAGAGVLVELFRFFQVTYLVYYILYRTFANDCASTCMVAYLS